ncbi:GntR family transcriptional regulator [Escherichia coli]
MPSGSSRGCIVTEKLPSVRSLSQEHGVSISTVQQAYQTLETMKLITPQPRSGILSHNPKPSRQCRR